MANQGWISIHRKIQECFLWENDEPFDRRSAWIDLLLLVNHEDKKTIFNGNPVIVKRGQRITSVRKLSERWAWSTKKTLSFLKLLESENMIVKESDNKKTLLTIVNYEFYQDNGNAEETQRKRKRNAEETQRKHSLPTNNNENNELNNENNENNENNIIPPISPQGEWNFDKHTNLENLKHILNENLFEDTEYLNNNRDVYEAIKTWMEYKDSRKPKSQNHYVSEASMCVLLKQFVKFAKDHGSWTVQGLVEKSLSGNYVGICWDYKENNHHKPESIADRWSNI